MQYYTASLFPPPARSFLQPARDDDDDDMVSSNTSPPPLATSSTTVVDQNQTIASQGSAASVVKLGTWGGDGGSAFDLTVAPQRLESITLRWGKVIDWIAFSYLDRTGRLHTAGPWGGNGKGEGTETMTLEPSEYVTGVEWSVGPFTFKNVESCITRVKFVSNLRSFGPFGHGVDSTHHSLPVLNGSVVGMFARAGDFLDAIGFYVLPAAALPAAVQPARDDPEKEEKEDSSPSQEENNQGEKKDEKDGNQEEKEEEKSGQEEKEKDSGHVEKENGNP